MEGNERATKEPPAYPASTKNGKPMDIKPSGRLTTIRLEESDAEIVVDPNYYVASLNVLGHK